MKERLYQAPKSLAGLTFHSSLHSQSSLQSSLSVWKVDNGVWILWVLKEIKSVPFVFLAPCHLNQLCQLNQPHEELTQHLEIIISLFYFRKEKAELHAYLILSFIQWILN